MAFAEAGQQTLAPSFPTGDQASSKGRRSEARPLAPAILRLIWEERHISRAEIARRTGLSRSTVSEAVNDLLTTGLVRETGTGETSGGRRPIVLSFEDKACLLLGLDIGASHVGTVLCDLRGRIQTWESRSFPSLEDPQGALELARTLCLEHLTQGRSAGRSVIGLGVSLPAPVDPVHPFKVSPVVLPAWEGRNHLDELRDFLHLPLLVDNDANLGALAEQWWGCGQGVADFAYIKLSKGIGLGQVLGGQIYRGANGVAGEIGHLTVDPRGRPCICGLRGCLATYVGSSALEQKAREGLSEQPDSVLADGALDMQAIERAALAGDPLALRVVEDAAEYLGVMVAGLVSLNNPRLVVLGGGLSRVGDLLLKPLQETVRRRTLVETVQPVEIRLGALGERAVAVGAATLILQAAFQDPTLFHQWPSIPKG